MTSDERRRAILECAARLFSHYGHSKTTIADIAREAQVGVGTVYLVFPSKEAIVEELSSSAHVRVLRAMRDVAQARVHDGFAERLTGVLEMRITAFHELAREGQHAGELLHCKNGTVQSVHARFREEEAMLLREILEDARDAAEIASVDVTRVIGLIQRAFVTLSPPWLYEQTPDDSRRTAYEMSRLVLFGIASRTATQAGPQAGAADRSARPPKPSPTARRGR